MPFSMVGRCSHQLYSFIITSLFVSRIIMNMRGIRLLLSIMLSLLLWISLSTTVFVLAFSPPTGSQHIHCCKIAGTSSSQLFLADEIKEYRKGLSQIHKHFQEVNNNNLTKKDYPPANTNNNNNNNNNNNVDCVFKFGGSSLANAERIDHVAHLIKDQIELGYRPRAVVCSAMGKTTNNLLSAGEFALGE
jgi:hypothetical protein